MEDKFIMMDALSTIKCIVANTAIAMNEASSDNIYKVFEDIFYAYSKEAKEIFAICYSNNWYQLEEAGSNKIDQEISKLCTELNKEE